MNIFSWLPFGKKTGDVQPSAKIPDGSAGSGPITGCDLSNVIPLAQPFARGPFYRLRPPFSKEAAELSLELAHMAYTLEWKPWREAGWNDLSILIDDSLQSGLTHWESGDGLTNVINRLKVRRAQAALNDSRPVSQVLGAIRQKEKSDTIKAVCMMHTLGEDRWVLAIGFMGTGKRFYDWISNFRFTPEEGFHRGFYQLCESFEMNVDSIVFPSVARALGLEKLTLGQVLSEMRSLSSRFRLWMAGHSQGAAVMQVFAHRLMMDWGVLAQNMVGYGYGSPTVATGRFVHDPAAYPLYHLLNREDPVTRMGGLLHLGLCLEYAADEGFRKRAYGWSMEEDAVRLRQKLAFLEEDMQDMPTVIEHMTALIQCLAEEKGADALTDLMVGWWSIPTLDRALWNAGDRAMDVVQHILDGAGEDHLALTGRKLNADRVREIRERLRPIVQSTPVRKLWAALVEYGAPTHRIVDEDQDRAYAVIVKEKLDQLQPFVWVKMAGSLPVRRYGSWMDAVCWPADAACTASRIRRVRIVPKPRGKMRMSYSAQRQNLP